MIVASDTDRALHPRATRTRRRCLHAREEAAGANADERSPVGLAAGRLPGDGAIDDQ
jgi:hypothetical protein